MSRAERARIFFDCVRSLRRPYEYRNVGRIPSDAIYVQCSFRTIKKRERISEREKKYMALESRAQAEASVRCRAKDLGQ